MYLNKKGESYEYDGVVYTVGDKVSVSKNSDFADLTGEIIEISTEEDMDTGNCDIDIYCDLEYPTDADVIRNLEKKFSKYEGRQVNMHEVDIDGVVMAPDEIEIIS